MITAGTADEMLGARVTGYFSTSGLSSTQKSYGIIIGG